MAKVTIHAYVYAWVNDGKLSESLQFSSYRMGGASWVSVFTDEKGPKTVPVELEIPDGFFKNWRQEAIKQIDQTIAAERSDFTVKLQELQEQREKLLALEFTAKLIPESDRTTLIPGDDLDIPF